MYHIYKKIRLIRSLKKFVFRYQDLVEIYSVSAEKIISDYKQTKSVNNRKTVKTVMTLTWYRHFQRNGGLNQILRRQTSRSHYDKCHVDL
jgi:hypothetical protein